MQHHKFEAEGNERTEDSIKKQQIYSSIIFECHNFKNYMKLNVKNNLNLKLHGFRSITEIVLVDHCCPFQIICPT